MRASDSVFSGGGVGSSVFRIGERVFLVLLSPVLPYFPFSGEAAGPAMGLKPLDLAAWIEPDATDAARLTLKADLLRRERALVLRAEPDTVDACRELYAVLADHLPRHHPSDYHSEQGHLRVHATGGSYPLSPPEDSDAETLLASISLWIQEDVCLLSPAAPVRLTAGSVCFPSRWNLPEKIGLDSGAIHQPVPGFKAALAGPTRNFLERITVDKPVWRLNWTIHDSDQLFAPHPIPGRQDLTEANVLDATFLRVERQTLRRLPATGAVVFTIRTYLHSMRDVAADAIRREALRQTLRTLPEEVVAYKGMALLIRPLQGALGATGE